MYVSLPSIPVEYFPDVHVRQAVKNSRTSYDILVDLFAFFENFLSRLRIYTGVPPTPVLIEVLAKMITDLIYTLALATKHVKRGRFSESVLVGMRLDPMRHRENFNESSRREWH